MNSRATDKFWELYRALPLDVRRRAVKAYKIWRDDPQAPGLYFKRVGKRRAAYSVRIGDFYRVVGLLEGDTVYWFWIGGHDEYQRLISKL